MQAALTGNAEYWKALDHLWGSIVGGKIYVTGGLGASGDNDFAEAIKTAVINKRAGGQGLISGRKAFQRPMAEGVKILNTIQDVYLDKKIKVA